MKTSVKWVDNVQFVAETGSGHAVVIDWRAGIWRSQHRFAADGVSTCWRCGLHSV